MNVTTITMPKEQAEAKLSAYQEQLRRRSDAEYEAALAGYQALAEGTPLISLTEAIRGGGFDEKMRPKLAVARADRRQVMFLWRSRDTTAWFDTNLSTRWSGRHWLSLCVEIDMGRRHGQKQAGISHYCEMDVQGFALVPMVPADVRPSGNLRDYFILWEVEQWSDRRIGAQADRDPYLLRHLGGDLYAVVAEWMLTDLERLVMAGRRQS